MSASFSKLASLGLKEQVIRALEKSILSGDLQPGDRLPPERELAATMGVSRSLMNLAILELESRGYVRILPRHGTIVNDFKRQSTPQMLLSLMNFDSDKMDWTLFDNMMDTRRLLEYECTRLAIKSASSDDLTAMGKTLELMEHPGGSAERFIEGNFRFHHTLTLASGNAVYAMIFNSFETAIRFFLKLFFSSDERRIESAQTHRVLLEAIQDKNEAAALETIRHALDTGVAGLSNVYKQ